MAPSRSAKGDEVVTHTKLCVLTEAAQRTVWPPLTFPFVRQIIAETNGAIQQSETIRAHIKPEINTSEDCIKGRLLRDFSVPLKWPFYSEWAAELAAWPALGGKVLQTLSLHLMQSCRDWISRESNLLLGLERLPEMLTRAELQVRSQYLNVYERINSVILSPISMFNVALQKHLGEVRCSELMGSRWNFRDIAIKSFHHFKAYVH